MKMTQSPFWTQLKGTEDGGGRCVSDPRLNGKLKGEVVVKHITTDVRYLFLLRSDPLNF